ncbi:MAG: DUF4229 domain-containing protein [Arthrobacter sp.]|nr:DUF4229 domain-containing protein [Arthrobacter sp.]
MKVFLYFVLRTVVFVAVACLVYFLFGWSSWGMIGAILAAVVGAVVAFAVGYLLLDRQRRAAAAEFGDAVQARKAAKEHKATQAELDANVEDSFQDKLRADAGLSADARTRNLADDEA